MSSVWSLSWYSVDDVHGSGTESGADVVDNSDAGYVVAPSHRESYSNSVSHVRPSSSSRALDALPEASY